MSKKAWKQLGWLVLFVACGTLAGIAFATSPWLSYFLFTPCLFLPRPWVR